MNSVDYGAFLHSYVKAPSATYSRTRNESCPGANAVIIKRKSLFAALAFALPIAALAVSPAMAAKPHKAKTHHAIHKASAHKSALHHKSKRTHAAVH
jgi:hypothetical protein